RSKNLIAILKFSRQFDLRDIAEYVKVNSSQPWGPEIQTIFIVLNAFINSKVRTQHISLDRKAIFPEPPPNNRIFLTGGIELMKGFWQTIRPGWATYYPSGNLIDVIPYIIANVSQRGLRSRNELRRGLTSDEIKRLSEFLKDNDITTVYRGDRGKPKHKVFRVSDRSAEESVFSIDGGGRIS
ncbi:13797_t:CDS:2, partial [Acaulospora colombiana]